MASTREPRPQDTESSDESSDQFTDASEGRQRRDMSVSPNRSPIPMTRVERIDDEPAYGEVPGTEAYAKRTQDAVPDEVEVVSRSRSASRINPADLPSNSTSPSRPPVPKIVAIKIDPDTPAYGEKPGTEAYEKRRADPQPDIILKSPEGDKPPPNPLTGGSPTSSRLSHQPFRDEDEDEDEDSEVDEDAAGDIGDEDGFGDDFDEFEEGQEGGNDDDDFGDFDDGGFQAAEVVPEETISLPPPLDWSNVDDIDDLRTSLSPYINTLFPHAELASQIQAPSSPHTSLLSDRSLSLYSQLVAPPPLAPPNWLRSRIRRLFLVSLGVPVDLDEILPASKQKKLVLPSIHIDGSSPRPSTDSRSVGGISRLKGENDSSASVDKGGRSGSRKAKTRKKDEAEEPTFDKSEATRLGSTTEARLESLNDKELQQHVDRLEELMRQARASVSYWEGRKESAIKEKEAFEGVIENLVKHARKVRK